MNKKTRNMNKHKQHGVVYATKEYSWFKKTRGNRDATPGHCRKIRNSIVEKDLEMVVYVNSDGTIREGHTTYEVRKDLALPIYYVINDKFTSLDVPRFNSGRENWSFQDTLNFYCVRRKRSYKVVKEKMAKYCMPIQETVGLLKGQNSPTQESSEDFKWGRYSLKYSEIKKFDELIKPMKKLWDVRNAGSKMPRYFIRAVAIAKKHPNFTWDRAMAAMKSSGAKMDGCTNTQEYIKNFGNIFDRGLQKNKKIHLFRFFEDKLYEGSNQQSVH
jgi:hypothetical protein